MSTTAEIGSPRRLASGPELMRPRAAAQSARWPPAEWPTTTTWSRSSLASSAKPPTRESAAMTSS